MPDVVGQPSVTSRARALFRRRELKLDLADIIRIEGRATVAVTPAATKSIKVGFIQTLDRMSFSARYNGGGQNKITEYIGYVSPLPVRDSDEKSTAPWYDSGAQYSPESRIKAQLQCSFTDEPSLPSLELNHPVYGVLERVSAKMDFTTWLVAAEGPYSPVWTVMRNWSTSLSLHLNQIPALGEHEEEVAMPMANVSTMLLPHRLDLPVGVVLDQRIANKSLTEMWLVADGLRPQLEALQAKASDVRDLQQQTLTKDRALRVALKKAAADKATKDSAAAEAAEKARKAAAAFEDDDDGIVFTSMADLKPPPAK